MERGGTVSTRLRRQVRDRASDVCEYCRTPQQLSPVSLEVDHVVPRSLGGVTELDNLCLACRNCNAAKQARTEARNGHTENIVSLFHPRRDRWDDHFEWSEDSTRIIGRTSTGRATVEALNMNVERLVVLRKLWVMMNVFPHTD